MGAPELYGGSPGVAPVTFKTQYGSVPGTDVLPPVASQDGKTPAATIRTHTSVAALCLLHVRSKETCTICYGL